MSTTRIKELRAQLAAATDAVSLDPPESILTASGVERGRALYDRRSPQPDSDTLGRSRRTRRSTERGIAWAQDIEQSKVLSAKILRTKARNARRRASMSASGSADELEEVDSQAPSQAPATQDGEESAGESQYETVAFIPREKLIEKLAQKINLDCTGLTTQEILDLLDAPGVSDNQTAPMEAEDNNTEIVVLPSTRVSIGGGFHLNNQPTNDHHPNNANQLPSPGASFPPINPPAENTDTEPDDDDDVPPQSSTSPSKHVPSTSFPPINPPAENTDTEPDDDDDVPPQSSTSPSKRALSVPKSQPPPKRSRIDSPENTDTEPEIEQIPPSYQVPRSRASTGTVIPDSQPNSPNPHATASLVGSSSKAPRTYGASRSFVASDSNCQLSQTLHSSQHSRGVAVSTIRSPSLGAPLQSPDPQASQNLEPLSRMSSISLGGSIPISGAQPRETMLHPPELQSQPRRDLASSRASQSKYRSQPPPATSQSQRESQAPLPTASHDAAPRSGTTGPAGRALGGKQAVPGALRSNPEGRKPTSDIPGDKHADTRERLHKLISVIIGRKEPECESGATSSQRGHPSCSTAAASSPSFTQPRGRGEVMPDDEEDHRIFTARAKGKKVRRRKNKPLTSDLEGRARQVIIIAKLLLFTYIVVFGPYLTRETYLAWAPLIYELAWYREYPELPYEQPPKGAYELDTFKKLRRPALTPDEVEQNLAVLREIYPKHFHCIDPKARTGHYQGEIMKQAISAAFFHGPHAIGILFHDLFDPIPIPTICFILANLQFCIEEWSTGHYTPTDLNLGNMPEKYHCHVLNIGNFRTVADGQLWEKRREWFKHAVAFSGASQTSKIESSKFIIDISEFRPDSPRPQPEPEQIPEIEPEDVPEHEPGWGAGPSTA